MPDNVNNDNVRLNTGTGGALVATDLVTVSGLTSHAQYVKLAFGGSGNFFIVGDGTDTGHAGGQSTQMLPVKLFSSNNRVFSSTNWTGTSDALDVFLRGTGATLDVNISNMSQQFVAIAGSSTGNLPVTVAGDSGGAPVPIRVGVSGSNNTMFVQGTAGGIPVGVCATNLDIRGLTLNFHAASQTGTGDVVGVFLMQGLSSGASGAGGTGVVDSVAVQGISGGYPVLSAVRGTTGAAGFAGVGVHGGGAGGTGAELLVRVASSGTTVGVDGFFTRIIGGNDLGVTAPKGTLAHGYTGTYGNSFDHIGIQGISNGLPVRSQLGAYSDAAGFTAFGASGDALLVALKDGVNVTANVSSSEFTVINKAGGGTNVDGEYLKVAGNTAGTAFVPVAGNTAGTSGISIGGKVPIAYIDQAVGITTTIGGVVKPLNIRGLTATDDGAGGFGDGSDVVGITGTVAMRALTGTYNNAGTYAGDKIGVTGEVSVRLAAKNVHGITVDIKGATTALNAIGIRTLRRTDSDHTSDIVGICGGVTVTALNLDIRDLNSSQDNVKVFGFTGQFHNGAAAVDLQGIPSLIHGASTGDKFAAVGMSADALLVSLKDGVNVSASISDTNFTISQVSNTTANMNPLPIVLMGVSGASGGSDNDTGAIQVTGTGGAPVAVVGAAGNFVPVGITVGTLGVTGQATDPTAAAILERLNTILGSTQGDGAGGLSRARSIYESMPADAGDVNGRMLPSFKQVDLLKQAFDATSSGGDNFITVLTAIRDALIGNASDPNGIQDTVATDRGSQVVGVKLKNFDSPNSLITFASNASQATNQMQKLMIDDTPVSGSVRIKAHPENTGIHYIANAGLNVANWKTSAFPLQPGEEIFLEIDNLDKIFHGSETAGNIVAVVASRLS